MKKTLAAICLTISTFAQAATFNTTCVTATSSIVPDPSHIYSRYQVDYSVDTACAGFSPTYNADPNPANTGDELIIIGDLVPYWGVNNSGVSGFLQPQNVVLSNSAPGEYPSVFQHRWDVANPTGYGANGLFGTLTYSAWVQTDWILQAFYPDVTITTLADIATWEAQLTTDIESWDVVVTPWEYRFGLDRYSVESMMIMPRTLAAETNAALLAAVPVPPAVWLFGSGLIGLVGVARSK